MEEILNSREEAVEKAINESDRSDLQQHADKMLRAFENFNDFSSNRAIWELTQNACDLTVECEITLDYREGLFSFSHNGKPFTSNALISLIKQVSGDKDDDCEIPPVGKYGTGFLTAHSLGRKMKINGELIIPGGYTELKDFIVDRSAKERDSLIDDIREQKNRVFQIIKSGETLNTHSNKTTFTFIPETDREREYIHNSSLDLDEYIPIVLTINERLKKATTISQTGEKDEYILLQKERVSNDKNLALFKTVITKNEIEKIIYSVKDEENEIEIILPVDKDHKLFSFSNRIARLFLYYPLVGSEDFGINFIINCNKFLPNEPRNGIHLDSKKDQLKDQEQTNRELIEKVTELLFSYLNSNVITVDDPLLYSQINFKRDSDDELLNKYFATLQKEWVSKFQKLPIVKTRKEFKKVNDAIFLDIHLFEDPSMFDTIYYFLDLFYPDSIPGKDSLKQWSFFVHEWDYENIQFVNNKKLAENIQSRSLSDFDQTYLIKYYQYLIETEKNVFNDFKLLPNIYGQFESVNLLKEPKNMDEVLFEIGGSLIHENMKFLIHKDFKFDFDLEVFGRRQFWNAMNVKCDLILDEKNFCLSPVQDIIEDYNEIESGMGDELELETLTNLLKYCRISSINESKSKPAQLFRMISEYYGVESTPIRITSDEEELDLRNVQRKVLKVFFNTLLFQTESWVEDRLSWILDILTCYEDRYKDIYKGSEIYPNQLFQLKYITDLKKDVDLKDEIIDLYNTVIKGNIKSVLANKQINRYLPNNEDITNEDLATKIESEFFETSVNINQPDYHYREEILKLIPKLNNIFYQNLFPRLYDKRANIMLEVVTNENTKEDIFSIVTLDEKRLKRIGLLIKHENIDEILNRAEEVIRLDNEKRSDFAHKYAIGTYIEDKIRERLSSELSSKINIDKRESIETEDIQGGQDIIISYGDKELYYIEVKSRWDQKNSISMSKLQLEKASSFLACYGLLSVDVTKYSGTNDKYKLSLNEIIPLIKVLKGIGSEILPLIQNNMLAEKNTDSTVKLADFRGLINQDIMNRQGTSFETFVDWLVEYLKSQVLNETDL